MIKKYVTQVPKTFFVSIVVLSLILPSVALADLTDKYAQNQQAYFGIIDYLPFLSDIGIKGDGTVVAVIDQGVWQEHPDLVGSSWLNTKEIPSNGIDDDGNGYIDDYYGWNFIDNNSNMAPKGSHGTAVAGIIAAQQNNIGTAGMAPDTKIMSLIACTPSDGCPQSKIQEAIKYAADNGADVINLSLGASGYVGYSSSYDDVIKYAYDKGVVIVASAGNGDSSSSGQLGQDIDFMRVSPASNDAVNTNRIIAVGALSTIGANSGLKINWSNYGSKYVDLYAPGEKIISTVVPEFSSNYGYDYLDGTSFSAPMVSAAAALIKGKFPSLKNYQIIDMILSWRTPKRTLDIRMAITGSSGSCTIPDVNIDVKNGEKLVLNATHLTPRLSLMLGSQKINNAVKILDANHLEIDTSILGLAEGQYLLATTDNNLYCYMLNVKVKLIGNPPTTATTLTPTIVTPPPTPVAEPKKSFLDIFPIFSKKSEPIAPVNSTASTSSDIVSPQKQIEENVQASTTEKLTIGKSGPSDTTQQRLWMIAAIILLGLLLLSNIDRLKSLMKSTRKR